MILLITIKTYPDMQYDTTDTIKTHPDMQYTTDTIKTHPDMHYDTTDAIKTHPDPCLYSCMIKYRKAACTVILMMNNWLFKTCRRQYN